MSQNLNRLEALWNKRRGVDNHSPAHVARYATVSFLALFILLKSLRGALCFGKLDALR
jgi:hypothetical protein